MPLQMVLRQIVVNNDVSAATGTGASNRSGEDQAAHAAQIRHHRQLSVIPIICVYPFLQKYFTKGRYGWRTERLMRFPIVLRQWQFAICPP